MKLQIPNALTIGRIILVPIFVITFYIPGFLGDLIPFFIFILASFTDFLDGLLASNIVITFLTLLFLWIFEKTHPDCFQY